MIMRWVQLSAARGPEECGWVIVRAKEALLAELETEPCAVSVIDEVPGRERGRLRSVLIAIEFDEGGEARMQALLESWVGTLQWIGKSLFRPQHKRRNWFVGVEVFGVPKRPSFDLQDVSFETMRAGGPGGQHVNKTSSAVRVTHRETGLSAVSSSERSQAQNRSLALARLHRKFLERQHESDRLQQRSIWEAHNALERGNPNRIYRGEKFSREQ